LKNSCKSSDSSQYTNSKYKCISFSLNLRTLYKGRQLIVHYNKLIFILTVNISLFNLRTLYKGRQPILYYNKLIFILTVNRSLFNLRTLYKGIQPILDERSCRSIESSVCSGDVHSSSSSLNLNCDVELPVIYKYLIKKKVDIYLI